MWGKVLGGLIGLGIGLLLQSGPAALALATVGTIAGWLMFDRESLPAPRPRPPSPALGSLPAKPRSPPELPGLLCPLFIEVARADAEVSQLEVRVVREFFQLAMEYGPEAMEAVRLALKDALVQPAVDLASATTRARAKLAPADRRRLVDALYELALVDGELKRAEADAIKQVVSALNLSDEQLQQITAQHLGTGLQHYATLGLNEGCTDDELRAAFKRLAAEAHPDRAVHLGPAEAQRASVRFREVKEAWEALKALRGL